MALRKILLALGLSGATLGACDDPAAFDCDGSRVSVTGTSGDTVNTSSGLRYLELAAGSGGEVVTCDLITVGFTGRLLDGTVFEEGSGDVVPGTGTRPRGFEQGIVGMRVAGSRRLIVPPSLGYGSQERRNPAGQVIVPANSTLVYDVTIIEVD